MKGICGCCEGLEKLTPLSTANRPGLNALSYRVGTHATFIETMMARLTDLYLELSPDDVVSWLLDRRDIKNPAGVIAKLKQSGDIISYQIINLLSKELKDKIDLCDVSLPIEEPLVESLISELNHILGHTQLFGEGGFDNFDIATQIIELLDRQKQLKQENNDLPLNDILRLNRLLLDAAYSSEIEGAQRVYPLLSLKTRRSDDFSIALLDAWAVVADVLTFYQERIANEGYLRTATERFSILELARLVGYNLRPGVASSVFLAFDLEKNYNVLIEPGMRVQSLPGSGELPQSFETGETLEARAEWNRLGVRTTKPHYIDINNAANAVDKIFLKGISVGLNPNDPILLVFDPTSPSAIFRKVEAVEPEPAKNRTMVRLQTPDTVVEQEISPICLGDLLAPLSKPISRPPATPRQLARSINESFVSASDTGPQLLTTLNPVLKGNLYAAWERAKVARDPDMKSLDALRAKARPFGHNAPLKPIYNDKCIPIGYEDWPLNETATASVSLAAVQASGAKIAFAMFNLSGETNGIPVIVSVKRGNRLNSRTVHITSERLISKTKVVLSDDDTVEISLTPGVRFINCMDEPVDVYINESLFLEKVAPGDVSFDGEQPRIINPPLDEEPINIIVKKAEDSILFAEKKVTIEEGRTYTIVAVGNNESRAIIPFDDRLLVKEKNKCLLRLINVIHEELKFTISQEDYEKVEEIAFGKATDFIPMDSKKNIKISNFQHPDKILEFVPISGSINDIFSMKRDNDIIYERRETTNSNYSRLLFPAVVNLTFNGLERKFKLALAEPRDGDNAYLARILQSNRPVLEHKIRLGESADIKAGIHRIKMGLTENPPPMISDEAMISLPQDFSQVIALDAQYDKILPGSIAVIEFGVKGIVKHTIAKVLSVQTVSKADFGITGDVTQLILDRPWLTESDTTLASIRNTVVYAQNEALDMAEEEIDPIKNALCGDAIELDGLYDGLKSGRWLMVSGERTDIPGTSGVIASELAMLASVTQGVLKLPENPEIDLPGDKTHTFLTLAQKLAYCYKLDSLTIYGNIARATHGETRNEVLGSGDAGREFQEFLLHQSPLTHLAAPTPAGAESTLQLRIDNVLWHETDSLAGLGPLDRKYVTRTDDQNKTAVIFGNGQEGARPATGIENIKAVYRTGIGRPGNVKAEQISLLAKRPLGVKGVINPLPATGGADRERRDQARQNAPLAVMALDRLVSVQDYADFARTFTGIGKARAAKLSDGRRQVVFLTIAGADDIPIDKHSDLYRNLIQALQNNGDPHLQIQVVLRELLLLVISANVRLHPDFLWDAVEPKIRAALLETFSFERRDLGQDVLLSEMINTIQGVKGVEYVDVDVLVSIPEKEFESKINEINGTKEIDGISKERRILTPEEILTWVRTRIAKCKDKYNGPCPRIAVNLASIKNGVFQPDQIAYLTPDVPDTLILREVKP